MAKSRPPVFRGDLSKWAEDLIRWLNHGDTQERVVPKPAFLQHKIDDEKAVQAGIMMYDPALPAPIVADGIQWVPLGIGFGQMNWAGHYPDQGPDYKKNDVVHDNGYTMIALTDTSDRPSPQPRGSARYMFPDTPPWSLHSNGAQVYSGVTVTPLAGRLFKALGYRIWAEAADPSYRHKVWLVNRSNPSSPIYTNILDVTGDTLSVGWNAFNYESVLLAEGAAFDLVYNTVNAAATVMVLGNWARGSATQSGGPDAKSWNTNNQDSVLRISKIDDDDADRSAELISMTAGTTIQFIDLSGLQQFIEFYTLSDPVDLGAYLEYQVTLLAVGPLGEPLAGHLTSMGADTPTPASTGYVSYVNAFNATMNIKGIISLTGNYDDAVITDDGYGIDVYTQEYAVSTDWELVDI